MSGFFAPELWPFSLAVGLLIGVAVAEAVALLIGASLLHWLGGDAADHPDGVPGGALGWLHFGRLPILVILVIFLTTFALAGFARPVRRARRDRLLPAAAGWRWRSPVVAAVLRCACSAAR